MGSGYWLLRQMILSGRKAEDRIRLTALPKPFSKARVAAGQSADTTTMASGLAQRLGVRGLWHLGLPGRRLIKRSDFGANPRFAHAMLKQLWTGVRKIVTGVASDAGDFVSDKFDLVATRVPLERAASPGEVTLDLPGYGQIDSYCCGAVAGIMALKHFKPRASFTRFYQRANPHREHGTMAQA